MITLLRNKLFFPCSHVYLFLSYVYFYYPYYLYVSFKLFPDHAVVIFPHPDRLHIHFQSDAVWLHQTHWNGIVYLFRWWLWISHENWENSCRVSHYGGWLAYNFPEFICSRWRNTKHITEIFLGQLIVVPECIAIDT